MTTQLQATSVSTSVETSSDRRRSSDSSDCTRASSSAARWRPSFRRPCVSLTSPCTARPSSTIWRTTLARLSSESALVMVST